MPRPEPFPELPVIHGDGFTLRQWYVSDAPAFEAASHDPEIVRWTAMPEALDIVAAADFVLGVRDRGAAGDVFPLAIADEQERAVGGIGVGNFDWRAETGEIFYWLSAEARGRGIATAAVRLLSRWAFDALGLARLELLTLTGNVASQRVAERTGFRREGVARSKRTVHGVREDLVVFARLPGDPDVGDASEGTAGLRGTEPAETEDPAAARRATRSVAAAETGAATTPADPNAAWIYFIHPSRDNFAATMTDEERAVWGVHWERLKRLYADGSVILVGPTGSRTNTGICVFEAPDEEAARRFMNEDPTIAGGYATGELRPFRVSLLRGRD